ncbi:VTT domain-containing protein [Lentzea sp. PSKA42]|uniref:TVP38/TMEM64 family membrane protein n=1 Tax=Lentzea indica TaxID=2604800 RepID=A0ABX1F8Z8_9PSEU|nr:VTT domain-containing protein [Lentzea indica]NKE55375.1 VTT domain-containing protein [Lentzea indica]
MPKRPPISSLWGRLKGYATPRLAAVVGVFIVVLAAGFIATQQLTQYVETGSLDRVGSFFALLALKILTYVVAPLGGAGLKVLAGGTLGWELGFVVIVLGDTIGSIANYFLGRYGVQLIARRDPRAGAEILSGRRIDKLAVLIAARFVLSPAWDLLSYVIGAKRVSFSRFVAASIIGGVPASIAWALLGAAISEWLGGWVSVAIGVAGLVAGVLVIAMRRILKKSRFMESDEKSHERGGGHDSEETIPQRES